MKRCSKVLVVPFVVAAAALVVPACSSSESGDASGGNGGAAGLIVTGGSSGSMDASVKGGSGGTDIDEDASVEPKDTSWFDGNWDGWWESCDGAGLPPPGGSPDCPSDLNLPGCPCMVLDSTAPCWTGDRKNRNRGACHDGTTKCVRYGEMSTIWSACNGEVLPDPNATSGKNACVCFSKGYWKIENLKPCIWGVEPYGSEGAMSTIPQGSDFKCDYDADPMATPPVLPSANWSKNWLTVDCAGIFKLCYELKAGDPKNPSAQDCSLTKQCVDGKYDTPGEPQQMPDLPAWTTADAACAQRFFDVGGYGEMHVEGISVECDTITNHMFNRVTYCPMKCALSENKTLPECVNCVSGGGGPFDAD